MKPIRALIFDLDGTLVQTEKLKAQSYAKAALELRPELKESEVLAAFKDVVGLSRREVAEKLTERFTLTEAASAHQSEFGVSTPWQVYVQLRLKHYDMIMADPEVLRQNQWPHNMALLQAARMQNCKTALATMSHCAQVKRVLEILNLQDAFDFVATRDDVSQGKPDPEIYQLVMQQLNLSPEECLIIEDSPAGVKAALASGAEVVAVSTPFTREGLRKLAELPAERIVDEPSALMPIVKAIFERHRDAIRR